LGLIAITDLFLVIMHDLKTRLTSQQPALLTKPATKSSPADMGYYKKSKVQLKNEKKTT
jgi:hypothetical protein